MLVLGGLLIGLEPVGEILPHRHGPGGVDLSGGVSLGVEPQEAPDVADVGLLGAGDDVLRHMAGDEDHAGLGAEHDVAGHADGVADAAGGVEARHRHIEDTRRVVATIEGVGVLDLENLLKVAHAAPDDRAAALGARRDGRGEVATHIGALVNLIEQVDDDDIILDAGVDNPLVEETAATFLLMAVVQQGLVQIGAHRYHHRGHGAANELLIGVDNLKIALELVLVALRPQRAPGFFQRDVAHAAQHVGRNLRAAILKALALPKGRQLDNVFGAVELHSFPSCNPYCTNGADPSGRSQPVFIIRTQRPHGKCFFLCFYTFRLYTPVRLYANNAIDGRDFLYSGHAAFYNLENDTSLGDRGVSHGQPRGEGLRAGA